MEPIRYVEEAEMLFKELNNESDRALAIAGAVYLEEKLRLILKEEYPDCARYDDDPVPGKGHDFCNWIADAYKKGHLSEMNKKALTSIRLVRNHFAHRVFCSFDDAEVQDMCRSLDFKLKFDPGREDDPRYRFAQHVEYLYNLMWIVVDNPDNLHILSV